MAVGVVVEVIQSKYYESFKFFKKRLILLTMLLSQNLDHHAALEYRGKKKGNDFVTVGKKF
jgi:hypothetical protein